MNYSLTSLKGGDAGHYIAGMIKLIKGDTWSLDYSLYGDDLGKGLYESTMMINSSIPCLRRRRPQ